MVEIATWKLSKGSRQMLSKIDTEEIYIRTITILDKKKPSSHCEAKDKKKDNSWLFEPINDADKINSRAIAYLITYIALSGEKIPIDGIPTNDGYCLHLDRAKIKSYLKYKLLEIKGDYLCLTDNGRKLLVGELKVDELI